MDPGYLGDVSRSKPPGRPAVGLLLCAGYVICDNRLARPAVAIVAINPRSRWTPVVCERESTIRSCTVCSFNDKPSITTTPFLHPGGCVQGSMIYGNELRRANWDIRPTYAEESNFDTDTDPDIYTTTWASAKIQQVMRTCIWKRNDNQQFQFVCRAEVYIAA